MFFRRQIGLFKKNDPDSDFYYHFKFVKYKDMDFLISVFHLCLFAVCRICGEIKILKENNFLVDFLS